MLAVKFVTRFVNFFPHIFCSEQRAGFMDPPTESKMGTCPHLHRTLTWMAARAISLLHAVLEVSFIIIYIIVASRVHVLYKHIERDCSCPKKELAV